MMTIRMVSFAALAATMVMSTSAFAVSARVTDVHPLSEGRTCKDERQVLARFHVWKNSWKPYIASKSKDEVRYIKLQALDSAVRVRNVVVFFGNGEAYELYANSNENGPNHKIPRSWETNWVQVPKNHQGSRIRVVDDVIAEAKDIDNNPGNADGARFEVIGCRELN